jgi:hypothetical protein
MCREQVCEAYLIELSHSSQHAFYTRGLKVNDAHCGEAHMTAKNLISCVEDTDSCALGSNHWKVIEKFRVQNLQF